MSDVPDLDDLSRAAAAARRGWAAIENTGGLLNVPAIAKRWGVQPETVREAVRHPTFPTPVVTVGRSELWLAPEVDHWRATPRRPGRPPKAPAG